MLSWEKLPSLQVLKLPKSPGKFVQGNHVLDTYNIPSPKGLESPFGWRCHLLNPQKTGTLFPFSSRHCKLCWYSASCFCWRCFSSCFSKAALCVNVCQKSRMAESSGSQNQSTRSYKGKQASMSMGVVQEDMSFDPIPLTTQQYMIAWQWQWDVRAKSKSSTTLAAAIRRSPTFEPGDNE